MKIKTELHGQPFEIEVDDSLTLELSEGSLIVRPANQPVPVYIPFMQPQPWANPIPTYQLPIMPYSPPGWPTTTYTGSAPGILLNQQ